MCRLLYGERRGSLLKATPVFLEFLRTFVSEVSGICQGRGNRSNETTRSWQELTEGIDGMFISRKYSDNALTLSAGSKKKKV